MSKGESTNRPRPSLMSSWTISPITKQGRFVVFAIILAKLSRESESDATEELQCSRGSHSPTWSAFYDRNSHMIDEVELVSLFIWT